jgi:hypothetical protein
LSANTSVDWHALFAGKPVPTGFRFACQVGAGII